MGKYTVFGEGDRVRYSGAFLRRVCWPFAEVADLRGTVTGVRHGMPTVVKVLWDGEEEAGPKGCFPVNLEKCRS
jgi:hypothetical protein